MSLAFIPGMPGWIEIVIFGGIVLLLFGNRMPGAMRSLGQSIVAFKSGARDADNDERDSDDSGDRQ